MNKHQSYDYETGVKDITGKDSYSHDVCRYEDSFKNKQEGIILWDTHRAMFYIQPLTPEGFCLPLDKPFEITSYCTADEIQ